MRILAITNLYPRPGHETRAAYHRQQFRALAADHELAVLAPVSWTDELRDLRDGRRPLRRRRDDGIEVSHPRFYFPPKILAHRYGEFFLASVRREADRLVREFRPEAVLGCWAHPDGWAAAKIARRAGLPSVIKVVGSDILIAGGRAARRARIAEALRGADAVAAVSHDLADHVVALGVDPGRVHVVHEGLDATLFAPGDRAGARSRLGLPPDGPIVLFVGNLLRSKGALLVVEACALLAARGRPVRCFLVGRGPDEKLLRSAVARHGLDGSVTLAGPRPHDELPDWYRACDLVALPSYSEGIPNVLREAASCGRPYVATRVGGIPEIAPNSASRLVPPGSAPEVADAIEEVLSWGPESATPTPGTSWEESARLLADVLAGAIASNERRAGRRTVGASPR